MAATTTSPTSARPSSSCRTRRGTGRCTPCVDETRHGAAVREDHRRAGEVRDALRRRVEAEPAARRPLRQRPRVPRRRCGAPRDPDRRPGHEQRRRRRHRPRLEARRHPAGLGRAEAARLLRDRAPPDRRAQRRRFALRLAGPAQMARPVAQLSTQLRCAVAEGRAAQEQRDDRRRARLPLRRLAAHRRRARRARGTISASIVPTTWPGARLPHVWLDGHTAIQDRIGRGYTLLRLGNSEADSPDCRVP